MVIALKTAIRLAACIAIGTGLQPAAAQKLDWQKAPRMTIERQYAGPLTDTLIQRLRDPLDGSICYLYLPISAGHSEKTESGYVQYGPNTIGSISCMPAPAGSATGSIKGK